MPSKFFLSTEEKERLFHMELVKGGVDHHQAVRVAKVLARNQPEEALTPEEEQLTEEACRIWLQHRQRLSFIDRTLASFPKTKTQQRESNCRDCAGSSQT